MTSLIPSPSVSLVNGSPATTSLAIAEHFGKAHDRVLKDIRRICGDCPADFTAVNFNASEYTDSTGRTLPMFTVFFDGFILLAMGYTGKQALQIKLVYIAAFNSMREQIAGTTPATPILDTTSRLSLRADPERKELHALVNTWVGCAPLHYAAVNSIINAHIGVSGVDKMTVAQVKEAIEFARRKIAEATAPALPPARTESDELECHFATIEGYVHSIADVEREIFRIVKDGMHPAMRDISSPRRSLAIQAHTAMESLFYSLDHGMKAAKATIRTALIASRM